MSSLSDAEHLWVPGVEISIPSLAEEWILTFPTQSLKGPNPEMLAALLLSKEQLDNELSSNVLQSLWLLVANYQVLVPDDVFPLVYSGKYQSAIVKGLLHVHYYTIMKQNVG